MTNFQNTLINWILLMKLSLKIQLGRKYWWIFIAVLLWPGLQALLLVIGLRENVTTADSQNLLVGFPLYCIAIGMGIKIIAYEVEKRTLEVCYTIPNGAKSVWLSKLTAAIFIIIFTEVLLVTITSILFTSVPASSIYGALQGSIFYLVISMWFGAILKSELMAAMCSLVVFFLNLTFISGRLSPLFNPLHFNETPSELLNSWIIQNYLGFALLIVIIISISFAVAEQREKLLAN